MVGHEVWAKARGSFAVINESLVSGAIPDCLQRVTRFINEIDAARQTSDYQKFERAHNKLLTAMNEMKQLTQLNQE